MKDSEFIDLLNLYVDHEITPVDAARLEAEVAQNPSRARIYREYCSMQKACMILAEQFRDTAPAPGADRVAAAAHRARHRGLPFAAAGIAVAACVAVLLMARHPSTGGRAGTAAVASADVPAPRAVAPAAVAADVNAAFQPLFNLQLEPVNGGGTALLASGDRQDPFAWMNQVQLAPIQRVSLSPLMLDPKAAQDAQGIPLRGVQKASQGPAEMTAFRLQLDK
jgi:hypothetical protein